MDNSRVKELLQNLEKKLESINADDLKKILLAKSKHHHSYSLNNMILAGYRLAILQNQEFTFDFLFNLWLAPFPVWARWGYRIQKGARGLEILVPIVLKKRKGGDQSDDDSEGQPEETYVKYIVKYVFDISQTEKDTKNENLPHRDVRINNMVFTLNDLIDIVSAHNLSVELRPMKEKTGGYAEGDKIVLNCNNTEIAQTCTLLHELAHHILGHTTNDDKTARDICELEAESTAYVVGAFLGIEIPSEFYIASWTGNGKKIRESLSKIDRASQKILKMFGTPVAEEERQLQTVEKEIAAA